LRDLLLVIGCDCGPQWCRVGFLKVPDGTPHSVPPLHWFLCCGGVDAEVVECLDCVRGGAVLNIVGERHYGFILTIDVVYLVMLFSMILRRVITSLSFRDAKSAMSNKASSNSSRVMSVGFLCVLMPNASS